MINIVGNTFTVVPIDKKNSPPSGALAAFLNAIAASSCGGQGTIDYRYGEETTYEPSKKLVIGDNVHYLMVVNKNGDCTGAPGTESGAKGSTSDAVITDPSGSPPTSS